MQIYGSGCGQMRIGLLDTSVGAWGQKDFYNLQEVGLAKELEVLVNEVIIYKAVDISKAYVESKVEGCQNTTLVQVPVKLRGANGIWDCSVMDSTLDVMIHFSDTQLAVPGVYRWCRKNHVILYPYIGVIESHSTSPIKKWIMDRLFYRNIIVYRKCTCFVKTPYIESALQQWKIKNLKLAPVGLDRTLLCKDFESYPIEALKEKWGYDPEEKVLLFIGRMTEEKHPLEMIQLYQKIYKQDNAYRLIMVGKGELLVQVKAAAKNLKNEIRFIDQIPNQDIWELYRIANCFVNLNKQEIFGMVILEAMYYGCKVVAWRAPGPEFIIEDGISGYLSSSEDDLIKKIMDKKIISDAAHERIVSRFIWEKTAEEMGQIIRENDMCEKK